MNATEAANQTLRSRNAAIHKIPESTQRILLAIRDRAVDGYSWHLADLSPVDVVALTAIGYHLQNVVGKFKICWGKD